MRLSVYERYEESLDETLTAVSDWMLLIPSPSQEVALTIGSSPPV
jgi:hypothetical protein